MQYCLHLTLCKLSRERYETEYNIASLSKALDTTQTQGAYKGKIIEHLGLDYWLWMEVFSPDSIVWN